MWPGRGSGCWIALAVILFPIWKDTACNGDNPDYRITVQREVTVPEGLCVTVPCKFTVDRTKKLENAVGYWQQWRDSAPCSRASPCYVKVVSSKSSETLSEKKSNFHLPGNPDTGDCTLTINDAKTQDTGWYYFRIEDGKDAKLKWKYDSNILQVTVTGGDSESCETSYPLTVQEQVSVPEGQCVTISCSIKNKRFSPTARGYWRKLSPDHNGCYPIVATNNKSVTPSDKIQTFRLTGDLSDGDCSLTINDVNKQDTGTYEFKIEDGEYRWSYRNKHVNLQVTGTDSESWKNSYPLTVQEWVNVLEGQCVTISCSITNYKSFSPTARGYWRKLSPDHSGCYPIVATNDKSVTPSDNMQNVHLTGNLSDGDCSLTINDANKQDAGTYQFRIEDGEYRWSYRDKHVNVQVTGCDSESWEKSHPLNVQEWVSVPEGQCVMIPCKILNKVFSPNARGYWRKVSPDHTSCYPIVATNDKIQNFSLTGNLTNGDCSLTITDANKSDAGKYEFRIEDADVRWSYRNKYLNLKVTGVPFNHSDTVNVTEGDNVTITFSIDSNPPAKVTWRRGQEREYMALGQVLVVIPAISRQQSGTYTCLAQNKHGNDTITFHVKVSFPGPSKIPITGQQSEISITNIVIGLVGITLGILCAILISKIVAKISGKPEPPRESAEDKPDSVYMNVHPTSQVAPVDDRRTALDFTDSNREQTQHYARIDFSKSSPNPHPRPETTETLYAEVKKA
uniref:Ig-like domain-containing protein n=1 Tax=Leptobrachium leishanense TaxID=445787 RepID=A0A8C5QEE4_9ANUR